MIREIAVILKKKTCYMSIKNKSINCYKILNAFVQFYNLLTRNDKIYCMSAPYGKQ